MYLTEPDSKPGQGSGTGPGSRTGPEQETREDSMTKQQQRGRERAEQVDGLAPGKAR